MVIGENLPKEALSGNTAPNFLKELVAMADAKGRLKRSDFFWLFCSYFRAPKHDAKRALPVLESMGVLHNSHHFVEVRQ